ncbi:hypothetical protein B0T24DRAFT_648168 [Lasiosphaeria ovina]|uniref:Glycosyl transferase CAP10 domain-containing protein n=1 Tax=Lasiosphaeria ovina TaxID=92902 RepID=A0AAE0N9T4_9PEZI|nr:hypothetical protein B0T24DRAFT_648168 [Lasiosphaeria ovina]
MGKGPQYQSSSQTNAAALTTGDHPIDALIQAAEKEFSAKLQEQSLSLAEAAAVYRERRGRHPPPGFRQWYEFAAVHKAVVVEEFWDQIYADLEPLWSVRPGRLRRDAADFEMRITVRTGKASTTSEWFWTQIWLSMIQSIEHLLPDMDLALNAMDEPRIVVPWEKMRDHMAQAAKTKKLPDDVESVVSVFQRLPPPGQEQPEPKEKSRDLKWEGTKPYWLVVRRGCAPGSAARDAKPITDFDRTPQLASPFSLAHMRHGFVANYTLSTDFCHQADLQGLSGMLVEPISVSATAELFPLFGGSKLAVNNDILLPAPIYWSGEERFTGQDAADFPWDKKRDAAVWRGVATGGRNTEQNWRAFQRHRFVAMSNGTLVTLAEEEKETRSSSQAIGATTDSSGNFALPPAAYNLRAQRPQQNARRRESSGASQLGPWVSSWADVGFTDLMCGYGGQELGQCNYTGRYFGVVPGVGMAQQFTYKYLPDVDGNSFSGRYRGFLRSTSLPVKATLFREWHDSRLVAWKHFVPMDNRFGDWYAIMEYFLGDGELPGHDAVAQRIAAAGKEWADRVLRKEDMQIYVLRLLLEYARVVDERRESMGWVDDLVSGVRGRGKA